MYFDQPLGVARLCILTSLWVLLSINKYLITIVIPNSLAGLDCGIMLSPTLIVHSFSFSMPLSIINSDFYGFATSPFVAMNFNMLLASSSSFESSKKI